MPVMCTLGIVKYPTGLRHVRSAPGITLVTDSPRFDAFLASPEFALYRRELALWVANESSDEDALWRASVAVCEAAREAGVLPEHLLVALRAPATQRALLWATDARSRQAQEREHRRIRGVNLLLRACFNETTSTPPS